MVGIASHPKFSRSRACICCGEPRASRSIPACWDHWIALPEDLRSALVISVGRGQIGRYGDHLMEAVRFWRQNGLWRSRYVNAKSPTPAFDREGSAGSRDDGKVVSFQLRRPRLSPTSAHKSARNRFEPLMFWKAKRTDSSR
jgi:hypothetical protein